MPCSCGGMRRSGLAPSNIAIRQKQATPSVLPLLLFKHNDLHSPSPNHNPRLHHLNQTAPTFLVIYLAVDNYSFSYFKVISDTLFFRFVRNPHKTRLVPVSRILPSQYTPSLINNWECLRKSFIPGILAIIPNSAN